MSTNNFPLHPSPTTQSLHSISPFANHKYPSIQKPQIKTTATSHPHEHFHHNINQQSKQQTRIKLLSSYQQSYLSSPSQGMHNSHDQLSYQQKNNHKYQRKIASDIKSLIDKRYQKCINQSINQDIDIHIKADKQDKYEQYEQLDPLILLPKKQHISQQYRDKIKILQQTIDEQIYYIGVEDRVYEYLIERINNRNKLIKELNYNLVVQKTVDFIDCGDGVIKDIGKIKNMLRQ